MQQQLVQPRSGPGFTKKLIQSGRPRFHPIISKDEQSLNWRLGKKIEGRYRLDEVIGVGAVGKVFLATDLETNEKVAVKICRPNEQYDVLSSEQILQKAGQLERISHENVVSIKGSGMFYNDAYIVMEYMQGKDLEAYLSKKRILDWADAKQILLQLCDGLEALHSNSIIHTDLKPANIFLTNNGIVKVFDLETSILKFLNEEDEEKKTTGITVGTYSYFSPEQALGKPDLDHRSDMHAVGIIMYRMFTGVLPFRGEELEILEKIQKDRPLPPVCRNPRIPRQVEAIIMKALAKDPNDRFQTIAEMKQAIMEA